MKKKNKSFTVMATMNVTTSVAVEADSLEAAIAKSRTFGFDDFVVPANDTNFDDVSDMRVTGVFES